MRYRGVIFRSKDEDKMAFTIPFRNEAGAYELTPLGIMGGWEEDISENEIMVAEFVLFDGTLPITIEQYSSRMGQTSDDDECNLYVRAVKVAVQDCGESIHDMCLEDKDQFAYACFQKIAQAKGQGLFDQRRILPQWKKAGYERSVIGEVVELVS